MPEQYVFKTPREEDDYCLFPLAFESDQNVFFHGTAAANMASIITEGFKPKPPLETTSFARTSGLALSYACSARDKSTEGCVLMVRVSDLNARGVSTDQGFGIYIHVEGPQPEVIGYCIVPAHYAFI